MAGSCVARRRTRALGEHVLVHCTGTASLVDGHHLNHRRRRVQRKPVDQIGAVRQDQHVRPREHREAQHQSDAKIVRSAAHAQPGRRRRLPRVARRDELVQILQLPTAEPVRKRNRQRAAAAVHALARRARRPPQLAGAVGRPLDAATPLTKRCGRAARRHLVHDLTRSCAAAAVAVAAGKEAPARTAVRTVSLTAAWYAEPPVDHGRAACASARGEVADARAQNSAAPSARRTCATGWRKRRIRRPTPASPDRLDQRARRRRRSGCTGCADSAKS